MWRWHTTGAGLEVLLSFAWCQNLDLITLAPWRINCWGAHWVSHKIQYEDRFGMLQLTGETDNYLALAVMINSGTIHLFKEYKSCSTKFTSPVPSRC